MIRSAVVDRILGSVEFKSAKFCIQRRCWLYVSASEKTRSSDSDESTPSKPPPAVVLRGVRRLLGEKLWSKYNYKRAERINPTQLSYRVPTGVRSANGGRNRGSAVHEQLHLIAAHGFKMARTMCEARRYEIHPFVEILLKDFYDRGLKLVCAELPVYDERDPLRCGSSIDLIVMRKSDSKIALIELKVGGDNYYNKGSGYMEGPLAKYGIVNSPLNQAIIQLLAYKSLFWRCYGKYVKSEEVFNYMVIFLSASGVHYSPLHAEMSKIAPDVLLAISNASKRRPIVEEEEDGDDDEDNTSDEDYTEN